MQLTAFRHRIGRLVFPLIGFFLTYSCLWVPAFALKVNTNYKSAACIGISDNAFQKENPADSSTGSFRIGKVYLEGQKRTRERVIIRELELGANQLVRCKDSAAFFAREANKVFNTRLFVFVTVHTVNYVPGLDTATPGTADVVVNMKERWYTFPYPILELADRSFNEWWYNRNHDFSRINFGGFVTQNNLTGNKDPLIVKVQGGFTQKLELTYSFPYINKRLNEGLRTGVTYATTRNLAFGTGLDAVQGPDKQSFLKAENLLRKRLIAFLGYTLRRGYYRTHTIDLLFNRTTVSDTIAERNPNYFLNGKTSQTYSQLEYNYRLDRRNIRYYPLSGYMFDIEAEQLGLLPSDDVHISSARIGYSHFEPLGHNFFYAGRAEAGFSTPRRQPYSVTRGLGYGGRYVRGYDAYIIDGPTTLLLKNTLRKRVFSKVLTIPHMPIHQFAKMPLDIYFKVFIDQGYVNSPFANSENRLPNKWLIGGGLGVDIVTFYDAVIRFEYSANRQDPRQPQLFFYLTTDI